VREREKEREREEEEEEEGGRRAGYKDKIIKIKNVFRVIN
jgi:hypothetical protein